VKSPRQVKILGVCRNFHLLSDWHQDNTSNNSGRGNVLYDDEQDLLEEFKEELGLTYHKLYTPSKGYLYDSDHEKVQYKHSNNNGNEFYWTRSYDNYYENLQTGETIKTCRLP